MKASISVSKESFIFLLHRGEGKNGQSVSDGVNLVDFTAYIGRLISFNYKKQHTTQDPYILG